jgi:chromosome segregation ATPase
MDALAVDDTRTLVHEAADQLLAEGERPTVASVRARIGRGSASTINSALNDWWAGLSMRIAAARSRPDVPEPLLQATNQLWEAALVEASNALAGYRQEADAKVSAANDATTKAIVAQQEAEKSAERLAHEFKSLEATRIELERRLTTEIERRQAADDRADDIRKDAEQRLAESRERVRHLEELIRRDQDRFDSMEKRLSLQLEEHKTARSNAENKHKAAAASWREQKAGLNDEVLRANRELHETRGRITALEAQANETKNELETTRTELMRTEGARAELQERLIQFAKVEESLRVEANALRESFRLVEADRVTLRRDLEAARSALSSASTTGTA